MITVGPKTELCKLAERYGSDKYFYYTMFYHGLLRNKRKARKVLELGIGSFEVMRDSLSRVGRTDYTTGASLLMWRDYFPEAEIYGLDNDRNILINEGRIHSFYCDQADRFSYPLESLGKGFDLIVEDGSHVKEHQLIALEMLMPLLAEDGIYIVEDIGYLSRACRLEFVKSIPHPAELVEFHNPLLGSHIAAVAVVRP